MEAYQLESEFSFTILSFILQEAESFPELIQTQWMQAEHICHN